MFPDHVVFLVSDDIKDDHLRRWPISEGEKQDPMGTKLEVKFKGSYHMGKLGAGKWVVSVCRNLNLFEQNIKL